MIVDDINIMGISISPIKTNSPLVVNSNTILVFSISLQLFKMI